MGQYHLEDLTGRKFGYLTVLHRAPNKGKNGRSTAWACHCDCGGYIETRATDLKNGKVKSCGCIRKQMSRMKTHIDITGKTFGRLTAIEEVPSDNGRSRWLFRCTCGNMVIASGKDVRNGNTKSCGCQKIENSGYKSGVLHPYYNPSISDEDREKKRLVPEYNEWIKAVYKKYDYTCQKCFRKGGGIVIHSHHIESYGSHKDLRTDLNNGIVLCKECHYSFHGKYGRNTNRTQLEEYLGREIEQLEVIVI